MMKIEYYNLRYDYNALALSLHKYSESEIKDWIERYPEGLKLLNDNRDTDFGWWRGEKDLIIKKGEEIKKDWINRLESQLDTFRDRDINHLTY